MERLGHVCDEGLPCMADLLGLDQSLHEGVGGLHTIPHLQHRRGVLRLGSGDGTAWSGGGGGGSWWGGALGPRNCRLSFNEREEALVLFLFLDVVGRLARGAGRRRGLGCCRLAAKVRSLAGYRFLCEGYASKWLTFPGLHLLVQEGTGLLDEQFSVRQVRCSLARLLGE